MERHNSTSVWIPGGVFLMGSQHGNSNERPAHEVLVSGFYLDRYAVTNDEYREFVLANPEWRKGAVAPEKAHEHYLNLWTGVEFPPELTGYAVINVSWWAAMAYAAWIGKRLPTEAEWEFAAGGKHHQKWSLGDSFDPALYSFAVDSDPVGFKVGGYPPNEYGLHEMSGGSWEWTRDCYAVEYYERSPRENPINLVDKERRALRGGSCHFEDPAYLRCTVRGSNRPEACHEDYSFRCAADGRGRDAHS